jgi:hypothetical protein
LDQKAVSCTKRNVHSLRSVRGTILASSHFSHGCIK